jgi:predicted RNA-binding Zn-ribbon protein involved in translation (DUF1610 family)
MPFMIALAAILVLIYAFCYVVTISAYTYARVYVDALFNVLGRPSPAASPSEDDAPAQDTAKPSVDVVAVPGYFHETVTEDVREVIRVAGDRFVHAFGARDRRARSLFEDVSPALASVSNAGSGAGEIVGALFGAVFFVLTATAHLLVTGLALGAVRGTSHPLRLLDKALRLVTDRDIASCQTCGERVHPYPVYLCPRCGSAHRDIRPGHYGVMRRICRCGAHFPTLIALGASRLEAQGPSCGHRLPRGIGSAPEIVWAFTGSVNTGKTRLVYNITQHLQDLVDDAGDRVELIGETARRLTEIENSIARTGDTRPTPPASQTAGYGLRLLLSGTQRVLYLFDPAGELNYSSTRGLAQRHLRQTRALVLVIDPLAVEGFWAKLPPIDRQFLSKYRSDARTNTIAFENTCECLRGLGARTGKMPLAIVLSRADLLDRTSVKDRWRDIDPRTWLSGPDWLDMGNVLRYADMNFKEVRIFRTATPPADGSTDPGLRDLTRWLLRQAGISFHGMAYDR